MSSMPVSYCLIASVLCLGLMISNANGHLCIRDPPQRLNKGDELNIDCYQYTSPPCGPDFPSVKSPAPTRIRAGAHYNVSLSMPIVHYSPSYEGMFEINIKRNGDSAFKTLGMWNDSADSSRELNVILPPVEDEYLLQAIHFTYGYIFYSCSDIVLTSDPEPQGLTTTIGKNDKSMPGSKPSTDISNDLDQNDVMSKPMSNDDVELNGLSQDTDGSIDGSHTDNDLLMGSENIQMVDNNPGHRFSPKFGLMGALYLIQVVFWRTDLAELCQCLHFD